MIHRAIGEKITTKTQITSVRSVVVIVVTFLTLSPTNYIPIFPSDGWAMSRYLPYRDIAFCTEEELCSLWTEFSENKGRNIAEDADVGYALEVTLRFPEDKMDFFREYPPLR